MVVMTRISTAWPSASSRAFTCSACHSASALPRDPIRISMRLFTGRAACGSNAICSGAWPFRAISLSSAVGAWRSLFTMAEVAASRAASCSGVSVPRRLRAFAISSLRISSARRRSSTRSGTTSRDFCHARNSRTSCSTIASAAAASFRRSRRLASATDLRSSRS